MQIQIEPINLANELPVSGAIYEETICPICKTAVSPKYISSVFHNLNGVSADVTVINYCHSCKGIFISTYHSFCTILSRMIQFAPHSEQPYSLPHTFSKQDFDSNIESLSPEFVVIYNQALAAESHCLDKIAGLGYRKSLEFLVKDFAIHKNPNDADSIKSMLLAQCIDKYISDPSIKALAKSSAWIGNDEAHYLKKQEDLDVSDMKRFIQAAVYFIGMTLITEKAEAIQSARQHPSQ